MATIKLTIEYDGTGYAGWQRQLGQPTIQETLESVIAQITQTPTSIVGAGRTDAGVHALGQVASFLTDRQLSEQEWLRGLNGLLPDDISVRTVQFMADEFHARYSATGKLYEYRILNRPERSALVHHRAWHIHKPLDIETMRDGARALVGCHDFSSFQGSPTDNENPRCNLQQLDVSRDQEIIRVHLYADRFLKQMVRAIVGTLVEVGQGKRAAGSMKDILHARDRSAAGRTAPAHGLYLVRVDY